MCVQIGLLIVFCVAYFVYAIARRLFNDWVSNTQREQEQNVTGVGSRGFLFGLVAGGFYSLIGCLCFVNHEKKING